MEWGMVKDTKMGKGMKMEKRLVVVDSELLDKVLVLVETNYVETGNASLINTLCAVRADLSLNRVSCRVLPVTLLNTILLHLVEYARLSNDRCILNLAKTLSTIIEQEAK